MNINWCRIFVHQHYAWRHKYHLANLWITTFIRSSKSMDPSPFVSTAFRSDTVGQRPTSWSLQSLQFAIYNTFWRISWIELGCAWPFTSQTGFLCNNIGVLISTTGCSVRNKVQNQKGQSFSSPNKLKNKVTLGNRNIQQIETEILWTKPTKQQNEANKSSDLELLSLGSRPSGSPPSSFPAWPGFWKTQLDRKRSLVLLQVLHSHLE